MSHRDMYGRDYEPRVPDWEEQTDDTLSAQDSEPTTGEPEGPGPDFSDTAKYVMVERPEVTVFEEPDGLEGQVIRRTVLTGRTERYHRERRPEDGDAEVVREPALNLTPRPVPVTIERHRFFDPMETEHRGPSPASVRAARARQEAPRQGSRMPSLGFII